MHLPNKFLVYLLLISILLSSCERNINQLRTENERLKKTLVTTQQSHVTIQIKTPVPTVYQSEKSRSPFEGSETNNTATFAASGVTTINTFPLTMLRFVGLIEKNHQLWAVLVAPDEHIYKVKEGDAIGNHYAKIIKISPTQVEVSETILDDKNRPVQHTVILPIKG